MKFFSLLLAVSVSFTFAAASAYSVDKQGRYLILGPGSTSCAQVLADLEEGVKRKSQAAVIIYSNWLAGNLTSYNRDTKATYSLLGDASFMEGFEWTLNYCKDNPNAIYSGATDALIQEFREDRYSTMSGR